MSKQILTKQLTITSDPSTGVSKNGTSYHRWECVDNGKKISLYYFGSEDKLPKLRRNKTYEIEVFNFGTNLAVERDESGPTHISERILPPSSDASEGDVSASDEVSIIPEENPVTARNPVEVAINNFRLYEYVMNRIVQRHDYAAAKGKRFLTKTGFKKLAMAFGISDPEVVIEWISDDEVQVMATAVAPNGRKSMDYAVCTMREVFGEKTKHNLLTKAITRAKNRAISNLVGCGLISFEEVDL